MCKMADKQRASKLHAILDIWCGMHNKESTLKTIDRSMTMTTTMMRCVNKCRRVNANILKWIHSITYFLSMLNEWWRGDPLNGRAYENDCCDLCVRLFSVLMFVRQLRAHFRTIRIRIINGDPYRIHIASPSNVRTNESKSKLRLHVYIHTFRRHSSHKLVWSCFRSTTTANGCL